MFKGIKLIEIQMVILLEEIKLIKECNNKWKIDKLFLSISLMLEQNMKILIKKWRIFGTNKLTMFKTV